MSNDDEPKVPKQAAAPATPAVVDEAMRARVLEFFGGKPDKPKAAKPDDQPKVPKVKELLAGEAQLTDVVDAATRAELERWFGLPSFAELPEEPPPPEDPEMVAARARRERAIGDVDPALLELLRKRAEYRLLPERIPPALHADERIAMIDLEGVERLATMIAEPRQVERPEGLEDDLKDVTPQALLRDLHRTEDWFTKTFEIVDMAAGQSLDIVAEVDKAMRTDWKLPPLDIAPFRETRAILNDVRRIRREPFKWEGLPTPHRWVKNWS